MICSEIVSKTLLFLWSDKLDYYTLNSLNLFWLAESRGGWSRAELHYEHYKLLKLQLRVFLAGQRTTSSSPIIGQCFDTMIVASSDKEWLQWPIEIFVLEPLETVLSHLKSISRAVRTSGEATEDPLKLEFLSSFRSKCWTLDVVLLYNCSDYLTNTWWSLRN